MKYKIFYSFFGGSKETGISLYEQEIENLEKYMPWAGYQNSKSRKHIAESLIKLNEKKDQGNDNFYENAIIFNDIKKLFEHVLKLLKSKSPEIDPEINFILSGFKRIDINIHEDLGVILQLTKRVEKTIPIFVDYSRGWYPDHIEKLHTDFIRNKIGPFKKKKSQWQNSLIF